MLVNCGVPASPMTGSVVGGGVAAYGLVARSAVIAMNASERARCRCTRYLPIWRTARAVASRPTSLDRKGPPACEQAEGPRSTECRDTPWLRRHVGEDDGRAAERRAVRRVGADGDCRSQESARARAGEGRARP